MIKVRGHQYLEYFLYQDNDYYTKGWVRIFAKILNTNEKEGHYYISKLPARYSYVSNFSMKTEFHNLYDSDINFNANIKYCDKIDDLIIIKMFFVKSYHLAVSKEDILLKQKIIDISEIID
jgi:hypothetical protein